MPSVKYFTDERNYLEKKNLEDLLDSLCIEIEDFVESNNITITDFYRAAEIPPNHHSQLKYLIANPTLKKLVHLAATMKKSIKITFHEPHSNVGK